MASSGGKAMSHSVWTYAFWPALLVAPISTWFLWLRHVNETVHEPYLDEFFHVPQAHIYCKGIDKWHQWDPKITTPPGVYILAWLANKFGLLSCDTASLRSLNAYMWPCAGLAAFAIVVASRQLTWDNSRKMLQALHTAVNICLFPPIWFFAGLFYTDVASTVFVLSTLAVFYNRNRIPLSGLLVFLLGAWSLLFRQTNIFWVAIFPAGIAFTSEMEKLPPSQRPEDYPITYAVLLDHVFNISSLIKCFVRQVIQRPTFLFQLIFALWPYISLVGLFAGFVAWNGGVVLGDKSNHVATIHTPQVLYLFAYIAFFSLPLILPAILATLLPRPLQIRSLLAPFSGQFRKPFQVYSRQTFSALFGPLGYLGNLSMVLVFTAIFALPAIHYNTIIHPFTLADNRHYVFYVFRILRLYPFLRYAAAPVYIICAWLVIQQLGTLPWLTSREDTTRTAVTSGKTGQSRTEPRTSFLFVWLATSALCLVTAPLVEPRYFILPWIVWRLQVSSPVMTLEGEEEWRQSQNSGWGRLKVVYHGDYRLYFETLWFLAINAATAYIFLNWGFEWPQEPGVVQRFLW